MSQWVILIYDIPNKPSGKRLYIWRKLKKLDAVALQDAVFILPFSDKTLEQMQWLAAEIKEMGGSANVFLSSSLSVRQDESLRERFLDVIRTKYTGILAALRELEALEPCEYEKSLKHVIRNFLAVRYYDYFKCELCAEVETQISALKRKINLYGEQNQK